MSAFTSPHVEIPGRVAQPPDLPWRAFYREWARTAREAGLFRPDPWYHSLWGASVLLSAGALWWALLSSPSWALRIPLLALLAVTSVQSGMLAHEALHGAVTRSPTLRFRLGLLFANLLAGHSTSRWQITHHGHHRTCNVESRDPDMIPNAFALDAPSARAKTGLAKITTRHQGWLLWLVLPLQGFRLISSTQLWLLRPGNGRPIEKLLLGAHFAVWVAVPALFLGPAAAIANYLLRILLVGPYVASIFLVNHVGAGTLPPDHKMPYVYQQIATTRNIRGGLFLTLFMGGLNLQVEHHLGPTISARRLHRAAEITRALAGRYGFKIKEMSYGRALREVAAHLRAIAREVPC